MEEALLKIKMQFTTRQIIGKYELGETVDKKFKSKYKTNTGT
jgi:hypothetical protein